MNYRSGRCLWIVICTMFEDVSELWRMRDDSKGIQVCKHDYVLKEKTKFLGQTQTKYLKELVCFYVDEL